MEYEKFKKLSHKKLKTLSTEEKIEYYNRLREHYLSLPYDETKKDIKSKNFLRAAKILLPIIDLIYPIKLINNESPIDRIENKGIIYVSNHLNSLDQFSLISAIGKDKPLVVLAKNTLLKLKRGVLYNYVGCEFIDLNNLKNIIKVFETLAQDILHGRDILIFPEGTRNTTEKCMLPFHAGAVMLAQETGTKIVPYAINEDYRPFKCENLFVRRGEEFVVSPDDDLNEANEKLEEIVATLIWENMELERDIRTKELNSKIKDDAMRQFVKKRNKLEQQRRKINV